MQTPTSVYINKYDILYYINYVKFTYVREKLILS
jgi:hypothetical protein